MNDHSIVMDVTLADTISAITAIAVVSSSYHQPCTLDEVYGILDLLGVGPAAIPALFPDRPCRPSRRCTK